ncbi:MAG TPA: GDYXXLXY domain-containing protein [Bacillus bacterium]|nr:GDYXXLXY domain-containing protein [Bacillus sp. (in: firmicutes)]
MEKADVWLTGRLKGYKNIEYGIENYFVPEKTGWALQEKIKYAYVKVAANGDSMLVEVVEE